MTVDCERCEGNGHLDGERCTACESLGIVELPDDAELKQATLHELVAYRRQVLNEAAAAVMARIVHCQDERARIGLGVAHYVLTEMASS